MKKCVVAVMAVCLLLLTACSDIDVKRADDTALGYIQALLTGDSKEVSAYTHPVSGGEAIPSEDYYALLSESYFINAGDELVGLDSADKRYSDETELEGRVIVCNYIAYIDSIFYDFVITVLDNEEGYGVVACTVGFCTDEKYIGGEVSA